MPGGLKMSECILVIYDLNIVLFQDLCITKMYAVLQKYVIIDSKNCWVVLNMDKPSF